MQQFIRTSRQKKDLHPSDSFVADKPTGSLSLTQTFSFIFFFGLLSVWLKLLQSKYVFNIYFFSKGLWYEWDDALQFAYLQKLMDFTDQPSDTP